jgi:hypothetical protein
MPEAMTSKLKELAPNLWLLSYPLRILGVDLRRNVTVIRLSSGKLIIHSTAPFAASDVGAISARGEPAWVVEALLRHDTFAKEGRRAFPAAKYLVPDGFAASGISAQPLIPPPSEWAAEIAVACIAGAPEFGEIVMLRRPSNTLIVADLIVNFAGGQSLWERLLIFISTVGGKHDPGVTRVFKKAIKDKAAYAASVRTVLAWDFDRIIVGHGTPIRKNGKEKLRTALAGAEVADF